MALRSQIIRLAHQHEELRPSLLRVLTSRFTLPNSGKGGEQGDLRWHVFNDAVRITDLTFAGKRGKMVDSRALHSLEFLWDKEAQAAVSEWIRSLPRSSYGAAAREAERIAEEHGVLLSRSQDKGVRVRPAGFQPFEESWANVRVRAEYDSFLIRDKNDHYNLPTCIPAAKGGKRSIKVFYRWVQDNKTRLQSMTFGEILSEMRSAGIKYHQYCAMD